MYVCWTPNDTADLIGHLILYWLTLLLSVHDIDYSVIFYFQLSCCYCTHCLYARALPFSYILIRSLLMTLDLHVQILALFQWSGIRWARACCEKSGVSPFLILVFLPPFYSCFCIFLDSCISDSVFILILYLRYHVWMLICDIAVIVDSL